MSHNWQASGFVLHVLYARNNARVAAVWLPPFNPPAEVLIWGERYFLWDGHNYVEANAFHVWPLLEQR